MKKILIVDDDPNICELLELRLRVVGYSTIRASNGVEAYAVAKSSKPDLIILDANMPVLDGYKFARELQWEDDIGTIPILILTAMDHTKELFSAIGVAGFMTKPFDSNELLDNVAYCLNTN